MDSIINFFANLFDKCIDVFSACLSWLLGIITSGINSFLELLVDVTPDLSSYWNSLSSIAPYTAFINQIFPLQEAGMFIGFYFAFIGVFLTVKYFVKLFIPFVG